MSNEKTWLEVEMSESKRLLRERLEELNKTDPDAVDMDTIKELKNIYKCLMLIFELEKP